MLELIANPAVISVAMLCVLCLYRINVLLALIFSAAAGGIAAGLNISDVMKIFTSSMGAASETALSYILLGAFAASMSHTGLAGVLALKISKIIKSNKYALVFLLAFIAVLSQNLIPVHIAFIPILIPPLLGLMNKLKLDRRCAACALAFGLKAPYIAIPAGFGLIFQGLIYENLVQNGLEIEKNDICRYLWILGLGMLIALFAAVFISYRKDREYKTEDTKKILPEMNENTGANQKIKHAATLLAALITLIVQLITNSLPLGALTGLAVIFGLKAVSRDKMDKIINEGAGLMGYTAFVMLAASGFAGVIKASGGIEQIISITAPYMMSGKTAAAALMLAAGLLITMGIGTSFGTIPILAVLYVPLCIKLGFSTPSVIILLAAAAALGDAGSPASDTTLGPTAGLNADGQHNHIWDTCIPSFIHYNTAIIISALAAVFFFG